MRKRLEELNGRPHMFAHEKREAKVAKASGRVT